MLLLLQQHGFNAQFKIFLELDAGMNFELFKDALGKFSNENLLATVILCLTLAMLAGTFFGSTGSEKIRFAIFVLVAAFFSGCIASISGILNQSHPSKVSELGQQELAVSSQILIPASEYSDPVGVALGPLPNLYGPDVLMNAPPFASTKNGATFKVTVPIARIYKLSVRLAAAVERPMDVYINDQLELPNALGATTGGWLPADQKWIAAGNVSLVAGENSIRLSAPDVFPHITALLLDPV